MNNYNLVRGSLLAAVLAVSWQAGALDPSIQRANNSSEPGKFNRSMSCRTQAHSFIVKGSTLYSEEIFEDLLREFKGQCINDVLEEQIVDKINEFYQSQGYAYSFVSDIKKQSSKLEIMVLEGHIQDVIFDENFDNPQLREYISKLTQIRPYNIKQAEKYLVLIKRLPGILGKARLKPIVIPFDEVDPQNPGTVDLIIENHFHRVSGFFSYDNRFKDLRSNAMASRDDIYVKHKGSNYGTLAFCINNPFNTGGQLFTYNVSSLNHEDNNFVLGYKQPINSHGTNILTSISGHWIKFPLKRHSSTLELGLSQPLLLSLDQTLDVSIKGNIYNSKNAIRLKNNIFDSYSVKKIILGVNYWAKDKLNGEHKYSLGYHQSIKIDQSSLVTSKHDKSFKKLIADGKIEYPIFSSDYKVILAASGQYSKNNLYRTEVFSPNLYSGARGFDDSEGYGDKGLSTSIELSKFTSIEDHLMFRGVRLYTYLDRSKFWNNVESFNKPKNAVLLSYGVGTDLYVQDNIIFNLEYSKPISKSVQAQFFKFDKKPSSRIYFGIRYEFGF